jgi:predicted RNase H-like HicB family nuclease
MTSKRSNGSSKARASHGTVPSGPFAPAVQRRAQATAESYRLILEPDGKGGFVGRALELPTVFERGASADECVRNTRTALTVAVATLLELGQRPPAPSGQGVREAQINIRLSSEEKLLLEESARRSGFRGVSDYVRSMVLAESAPSPRRPSHVLSPRPSHVVPRSRR